MSGSILKVDEDGCMPEKDFDVTQISPGCSPTQRGPCTRRGDVAGTHIDQVFIGSCMRTAGLKTCRRPPAFSGERKFSDSVRVIVIPASREEYLKSLRAGFIERFVEAGALVEARAADRAWEEPSASLLQVKSPCPPRTRNFRGRGRTEASVYLCSPATAAASAIFGEITDPREV